MIHPEAEEDAVGKGGSGCVLMKMWFEIRREEKGGSDSGRLKSLFITLNVCCVFYTDAYLNIAPGRRFGKCRSLCIKQN